MKRIFILSIVLITIFSASATAGKPKARQSEPAAQTDLSDARIKRSIMDYLKVEGYVPYLDEDKDVVFKAEGTSYYIHIYEATDTDFRYLELVCLFDVLDETLADVAAAANDININFKQVRVSYTEDEEGGFTARFDTPAYITDPDEFNRLISEYIICIDEGSDRFFEILASDNTDNDAGNDEISAE